jgi:two-component system sensor histidine kinase/response regulator
MNAIIGMTGIAKKARDAEERAHCFDNIEDASKRLLDIVNNILDITGFDTGEIDWKVQPFSFSKAMRQVIDSISVKTDFKHQQFTSAIDPEIPDRLVSDERRLKQILINLLSNSVKFTAENGLIGLSAQNVERTADNCVICFEVSDTGVGIAKDAQERLWDVFEQEDNSITRRYGGMGLGLSLTRRIVELMKGSIRVESEPGKGSRFICEVRLDIERNPPQGEADGSVPSAAPDGTADQAAKLKGLRVLVVDDEEINREILCTLLGDAGAECDGAGNGAVALSLFAQAKYDLVLMDLHMPVMDGLDATRAIRASRRPWASTIPVISVSADTGADIHSKCLAAGINSHIAKPVDPELLLGVILKWLSPRPPQAG